MAKKSRVGSFRGKISSNDTRKKRGGSFSYISLPSGFEMFAPEAESEVTFDFLPYQVKMKTHPDRDDKNGIATPGEWWYKLPFRIHKDVGVQNVKVVCPASFGKPCPICDYRAKLKKEDGDDDEIKALNTSDRDLYAIKPKANKKLKDQIYLYDASDFKFQEVFRSQLKRDERWETFPHPEEGCSLKVVYDEATFNGNKYAEPTRFDFVDRKKPLDDSLLDDVPNLEECLIILSYEELKAKFFDAEVDDDDEDEKPVKKSTKKEEPAKKSRKPEPVEEEEDEEDEEDDDDEEIDLSDEINEASTIDDLLEIAKENPDVFKKNIKTLKTITKVKLLKNEMLAMLPEEEEDEEDEEDEELIDLASAIDEAEEISDLLAIAKENPDIFKAHIKELRGFTKLKLMKKRMVELAEDETDLTFEEEEEEQTPLKKQKGGKEVGKDTCPSGHKFGKDNDEFDECDACPLWNPCYKKSKEK